MPVSRTGAARCPHLTCLLPNTRAHLLTLLLVVVLGAAPETARAATLSVPAGGSFQAALDAAQPGDTIELAAGATFVGPFTLPDKNTSSTEWITIRTSAPDSSLPPAGQRITPAYASVLPKIASAGFGEPALRTAPRAHHYRFLGVEFVPVDSQAFLYDLILLGDLGPNQDSYDEVPHHIVLDRCYVHAYPTQGLKRGIMLNSAHTEILNSYVAGFKVVGQEAQAIAGFNGPGPFKIVNNYLEGAGENLLFGGAEPSLPNLVPSDIEIRGNHFYKPRSWREGDPSYAGQPWTVKNILELKNARRVVIEGNVFENNWAHAQSGFAIVFTPRPNDSGPAAVVEDVQFVKNILKDSARGINFLGLDDIGCPAGAPDCWGPRLHRVTVANNVLLNIGAFDWDGRWLQVLSRTVDVTVDHNTVFHSGTGLLADGLPNDSFAFTNNLLRRNNPNAGGISGSGTGEGIPSLEQYFPGADVRKNLIHGVEQMFGSPEQPCWRADLIGCYPAGNFYPPDSTYGGTLEGLFVDYAGGDYRLAAGSPYRNAGTDGKDVGADIDALEAATAGAVSGIWPPPPPSGPPQTPFLGVPFAVPGTIAASDFDQGGKGVAYEDLTPGNGFGSSYRSSDVDMYETTIVQLEAGEWLEYTIDVGATRSTYAILLQMGEDGPGNVLHVEVDGVDVTGPLSVPETGGWGIWGSAIKTGVTLTAGRHVLRVSVDDIAAFVGFHSIRIVDMAQPATPYSGTPVSLPGLVRASEFDQGGELVGYHDNTPGCAGECWFRSSDVDLWDRFVIRASAGEWMQYSVNVAAAGTYTLAIEVATDEGGGGGTFHVEFDGVDVTGPLTFPETGGWYLFQTLTKPGVTLSAGPKTMRIVVDSNPPGGGHAGSFNSVRIQ